MPSITISVDCRNCGGDGYTCEPRKINGREVFDCPACQGTGRHQQTYKTAIVKEVMLPGRPVHWNLFLFDRQTGTYLEQAERPITDREALLRIAQTINA
jgi:hypothetical protein